MVDSRAKGSRAESKAKDILTSHTGLNWQRIPASGALDAIHGLKGDIYIPDESNKYCVEVKSYKDSAINHLLISGVGKPLVEWIEQAIRQGMQVNKKPLLIFKHDRSKFYICSWEEPANVEVYIKYQYDAEELPVYIAMLEDWLKNETIEFI